MVRHKIIMSKTKKAGPLLADPLLSQYVPVLKWFDPGNLKEMLAKHSVVYLKPDKGYQGKGIIRLKLIEDSECEVRYKKDSRLVAIINLLPELRGIMGSKEYIIQQGIDLATYKNCPFDIRMVLQRPYSTWQLTLTSAKVALREDAIVTNVSRGAQDYPLIDILKEYDQNLNPMSMLRELVDLAHQGAEILGSVYPFRIIGFDMAVDKEGKVWFLEANSQPQCAKCILVNDESSVKKYHEAKAVIGPLRKKT